MGFPDTFRIPVSDTQAYRQFGNSVVVPVVEAIARTIEACLAGNPLPMRAGADGQILMSGIAETPEKIATGSKSRKVKYA